MSSMKFLFVFSYVLITILSAGGEGRQIVKCPFDTLARYPIGRGEGQIMVQWADENSDVPVSMVFAPNGNLDILYSKVKVQELDGKTFKIVGGLKLLQGKEFGSWTRSDPNGFYVEDVAFPEYFRWDRVPVFLVDQSSLVHDSNVQPGRLYYKDVLFYFNGDHQLCAIVHPGLDRAQNEAHTLGADQTKELLSSESNADLKQIEFHSDKSIWINREWVSDGKSGFPNIQFGLQYSDAIFLNRRGMDLYREGRPYKNISIVMNTLNEDYNGVVAMTVHPNGDLYFLCQDKKELVLGRIKNTWALWQNQAWEAKQREPGVSATLNDDSVRLRNNSTIDASIVGVLNKGDRVTILDQTSWFDTFGDQIAVWFQVKTPQGTTGWIFGAFLDIQE